ncbi:MAG TPA: T9SS type A sorting domain-containing protein [Hymenobacter sp.]|jgi:hypothetical protein|uniref:T9SS type A sorting domain-containing protein n=1 Tax=Hymenobacter sp. TaxID=1898978 RepID=UPI002EDB6E6C
MLTSLPTRLKKASRLLPLALLPFAAQAQLNYAPANATNVAGTYTDLGTTGTAIATASTDDANSAATPIGFTFNYNGTAFTDFVLNTNGFLKLGTTAPSAAALFLQESNTPTIPNPISSTNAADVNIVAPFNMDLSAGTATGGTEYRVVTTGISPNRVCTIQWKNVADKTVLYDLQYNSISFQVKLYETTGNIEFVYDTAVQGTNPDDYRFAIVGLKGSSSASGQTVLVNKGGTGTTAWSTAVFITGFYTQTTGAFNYRGTVRPDAGRTFRFAPTVVYANDLAVQAIYTQGQLATFSPNHVVRVRVSNVGTSAYTGTTTLTVSRGATALFTTTQTVTALAAGASTTVVFPAYDAATMANAGTNSVTVSSAADDNSANNTQTLNQVVSTTTVNYASPTTANTGALSFGAAGTGNVGSRFTTTTARQVVSIQAFIANGTGTATGVLFSGTGAELGRSAARTLTTADAGTVVTFTLATPVSIGVGDFIIGLNLAGGASLGSQAEVPTRAATFYQINTGPTLLDVASSNLGRFNLGAVTIAVATATRNEALAATVSLSPNPAHGTFTLGVPAGNLRTASATLINALGQVVQTRQLNLPAAGGKADFDVSRLAAGVYSLSLKSGNDLVVKRVVVE